jgi:hypothetical protein
MRTGRVIEITSSEIACVLMRFDQLVTNHERESQDFERFGSFKLRLASCAVAMQSVISTAVLARKRWDYFPSFVIVENQCRSLAGVWLIASGTYFRGSLVLLGVMRSKELNLSAYDTDKTKLGYLEIYDPVLAPWVHKNVKLLELGVHRGGSLKLWRDYFPRGIVVGIDRKLPERLERDGRIEVFEGRQQDPAFLSHVANTIAPEGFDIIVDDASHVGDVTKVTFWHLFDHHLKPGGIYAIEDWGTGYLNNWPDGQRFDLRTPILARIRSLLPKRFRKRIRVPFPCHAYGMVGFVKELVDEQGAASIAAGLKTGWRRSKFEHLLISHGIVFVMKAALISTCKPVDQDKLGF